MEDDFMAGKNHGYCIIKGRVENLAEIQEMIDSGRKGDIIRTMMHKYGLKPIDAYMFAELVFEKGIPSNYDAILEQRDFEISQRKSCLLHCPHCGSTNVEKRRYAPLPYIAAKRYWYCKNCHSRFNV